MGGFTKLDSGIVCSSIWSEPLATRVLWITLLAQSDDEGYVSTSLSGLRRTANITQEEFDSALKTLLSPDPESRTKSNEGRRIIEIEGGFSILNYSLYRDKAYKENRKAQVREAVRAYRERNKKECNHGKITSDFKILPSASASSSASASLREESVREEIIAWRKNYSFYQKEELEAYTKLINDKDWLSKQEKLKMYSGINVMKSLEKAHTYWSSEEGWRYKARKKSTKINWPSTYANALTMRCNMVFDPSGTNNQPAKPKYCGAPPDYLKQD